LDLGKYPLIALPLDDRDIDSRLSIARDKGIDIIELRIDMFSNTQPEYVKNISKKVKNSGFSIIATVRSVNEGGSKRLTDHERLNLFRTVSDYADIIDIELRSINLHNDLLKLCKDKGKFLLVSYHDFEKTPSEEEIQRIIDLSSFGDIIKFAFMVNSTEDVGKIMSLTHKNRDKRIVSIGMGDLGKITRVAGFFFGSLITYTYIGESVAPGQIEVEELLKELKFYGLRR